MKLILKDVRIVYPELLKAKVSSFGGEPRFSAVFLIEKGSEQFSQIEECMKSVATSKWGNEGLKILKSLLTQEKTCFRDGDASGYAGFENKRYITSSNTSAPTVKDLQRNLITSDKVIVGGGYVNCILDIWTQDNAFGKKVNASLLGVQHVRAGDHLGSTTASDDDFDYEESESTSDMFA